MPLYFWFPGRRTVKTQPTEFTCHASQSCQQDIWPQPAPKVRVLQYQWGSACSDTPYAQTSWSPGTVSLCSIKHFKRVYNYAKISGNYNTDTGIGSINLKHRRKQSNIEGLQNLKARGKSFWGENKYPCVSQQKFIYTFDIYKLW